jgi:hypothetical protein
MSESKKQSRPKELSPRVIRRFVKETLELHFNNDVKILSRVQAQKKIRKELDPDINFVALNQNSIDIAISIVPNVNMENRKVMKKPQLRIVKSKINTLDRFVDARQKILVLTNRSILYALHDHLKKHLLPEATRQLKFRINPDRLIIPSLGIEVWLVEYPIFVNEQVAKNVKNPYLTFSQILGGFQYGVFTLDSMPETGWLAAPVKLSDNDSKQNEKSIPTQAEIWSKNPEPVPLKEIVIWLYQRSIGSGNRKGKPGSKFNKSSGGPSSPTRSKRKVKQTVRT